MSERFYADLPPMSAFDQVVNPDFYRRPPADWRLVATDIVGSTAAIAAGRYKEVNVVGAAAIAALLNVAADIEIPFVFGGDGATLLVPPTIETEVARALVALRGLAREMFALDLRVALIPLGELYARDHDLLVARYAVSPDYAQAMLSGSALAAIDHLMRGEEGERYAPEAPFDRGALDLSGLECRWYDIPSRHGETLSLLVRVIDPDDEPVLTRALLREIERCFGPQREHHPLDPSTLSPALTPGPLSHETRLRATGGALARLAYLVEIAFRNLLFLLFLRYDVTTGDTRWRDYLHKLVETADVRKYDSILRMVLSGTTAQRADLESWLEARRSEGRLEYGIHVSNRALMTCLVFERMGRQVHFVDAADGGYALAARAMRTA